MTSESHYRKLERFYLEAPTNDYYQPRITVEEGKAEISITVRPVYFHAARAVHGSVYFKLLDDAAFFAANSKEENFWVLTSSFHIHLLRPVQRGEMRATGRLVHHTRRVFVAESQLTDSDGNLIATGSGTFLRSQIALGANIGAD